MNLSSPFCLYRGFKKSLARVQGYPPHSRIYKCAKLSAVTLSQTAPEKSSGHTTDLERAEVVLLKSILTCNKQVGINKLFPKISYPNCLLEKITHINSNNYKHQLLVWENILFSPKCTLLEKNKRLKSNGKETTEVFTTIKPEMWYCNAIHARSEHNNYPDKHTEIKDGSMVFHVKSIAYMGKNLNNKLHVAEKRKIASGHGPSPEQLSLVLLRLREELPHFFDGHHRYSIYSEDLLFVNKLTRTTTRSLKAYKFIMKAMQYAGRFFWSKVSFEVVRITKHSEDNTIKVRWTAKGIPCYQLPFFVLAGKPRSSLFYRYVDGFSIFEVGRDGLVHCHRLDKVIPTASPERQKWSLRMQILTVLGLVEIDNRRICEAFQGKNQDMLKKV